MEYVFDDGGRTCAGYRGATGDCVTRAITIAMELPYQEVYAAMAEGNAAQRITKRSCKRTAGKRTASHGIDTRRQWFKDWMAERGWKWVPTMQVGSGCKVHLRADELPAGRLIVAVSKHYCAVIDGVIHDIYDQSRGGTRCVYGYWTR